jgi:hypothetical protein
LKLKNVFQNSDDNPYCCCSSGEVSAGKCEQRRSRHISAKASERCGHIHPPTSNPGSLFHLPETRNGDVMMRLAMKAAMRS